MTPAHAAAECPRCRLPRRPALCLYDPAEVRRGTAATCWPCLRRSRDADPNLDAFLRAVERQIPAGDYAPRQLRGYHHTWAELSAAVGQQRWPRAIFRFYLGWLAWRALGGSGPAAARAEVAADYSTLADRLSPLARLSWWAVRRLDGLLGGDRSDA